jgi:RND family efflux transporter MFP subunit
MRGRFSWALILLGVLAWAAGCTKSAPQGQAASLPVVPVSHPVERPVTDSVEYTGRLDAVQAVGIKARATGFMDPIPKDVKEGAEIKAGALIFQIDPRPYKAQLDQAQSQVVVIEAQLKLAQVVYARAKESFDKGVGSKQDVDQAEASVTEAKARIKAAQAVVETNQLNLDFTQVKAPIDGQMGRFYFTPGNLIVQDQTLLTTIVSVNPMYAYFDMDERTILKIRGEVNAGKIKLTTADTKVLLALEGETEYPHQGKLDFVNNVINPSTGTVSVRGVFDNPLPPNGRRLLSPGMFVRIRLPIGQEHPALLILDRAIGSDQGLKYVYIVTAEDKVAYRRVVVGALQEDGLRVIEPYKPAKDKEVESGVKPDEWVVVGSLPQLRPQMEVSPEPVAMPTPGGPTTPTSPAPPAGGPNKK